MDSRKDFSPLGPAASRAKSPRRKPLEGLFEDLKITPTSSNKETMETVISRTFRKKGWPNWSSTISRATSDYPRLFYTIQMDSKTRAYIQLGEETPHDVFNKTTTFFETIQTKLRERGEDGLEILSGTLTRHLATMIFGSNYIERAGLGLEETIKICEMIFKGEQVDPEEIPERELEYEKKLIGAIRPKVNASHIVRSRREVVQHALALQYIIGKMVVDDEPMSEDIILTTHRILTEKIDAPGGTPWQEYSGKYRHVPVHAGSTNFVAPKFVRRKTLELVQEFNEDIRKVETTKVLDPFVLAAKYCNDFVMIHPFLDGNGRMCRMILNAILLKYAGIVVCLGEHDESRDEYLSIQKRAGEQMEGSGELAALVLRKAMARYRTLKQKLTGKNTKQ